jgi:hypothetical protein
MLMQVIDLPRAAANDEAGAAKRERTVPIPSTITRVPGYPDKLCLYKMQASKFWQVRCWIAGRTYRRSTKTQNLRQAQSFARTVYEEWLAENYQSAAGGAGAGQARSPHAPLAPAGMTFGALAAQMFANEEARVGRGEWTVGSLQVLRNRLDSFILPRWGNVPPSAVSYQSLLDFINAMSDQHSTITISQYLVAVRKVLRHAVSAGHLDALPDFPKVKVITKSRGAFTPTEYRRIIRQARSLRGVRHPESGAEIRIKYKVRLKEQIMPSDLAWAIGFMVHGFIRPSDLKTLKHKHVEIVRGDNTYLRLTLPETKSHGKPIVTLYSAVRIYEQIVKTNTARGLAKPDDYLFMPQLRDRHYMLAVLSFHLNWVLGVTGLKDGAHGQPRSMYSFRHSAITFRLLYGQGIDLLTLARNARTSVDVINTYYASTVTGEQNIALLQSRRTRKAKA